jgi:phosphoribosylanthranilate isomerase
MTWVKICGTTNLEDALTAVEAGADAVGFVFYEKSPRNVSVEVARKIVEKLPEGVEKIGVFVSEDELDPNRVLLETGLTGTQTYLSPGVDKRRSAGTAIGVSLLPKHARLMIALSVELLRDVEEKPVFQFDFSRLRDMPEGVSIPEGLLNTFVLDSGDLQMPGGTGKTFDWERAVPIAEALRQGGGKLVVAGGLTPDNVGEAMRVLKPWGVDVASGVEARPGKKDPEKVRAFVNAVRESDRNTK